MTKVNWGYLIPRILLHSRWIIAIPIASLSFYRSECTDLMVFILLLYGLISDIFDGILARKFNTSTPSFRKADSIVDLVFFGSVIFYLWYSNPQPFLVNIGLVIVILSTELTKYLVSLIRFGKMPSAHATLAKFWGLWLVIEFSLLLFRVEGMHFTIALIYGAIVHLDSLLIYLFLKQWDHDIPSCWHALQLRKGKEIKRFKIFNG
ncbi:CDP-alcohol phosphatidyltransferase family protein [Parvicella tangerina]|uniref:CDP-alcohol phosphatidyltransferase family protein n=1 Tax=Parvicella tangerina TaxID=2829795 RepID=A0A916JK07_9FLAO|nr:CDP-alcohol phosphatidyltransferase family protein [Parvicella tangerina]CAG5076911.1 hypothetical protein CRYO30217_00241 [Parvicella tangerina]